MAEAFIRNFVSRAFDVCSKRSQRLALVLCVPVLLLAVMPAWGDPGRGIVGDDGFTHRITINSSGYISMDVGQPVGGFFPATGTPSSYTTYVSPYQVCREAIQVPGPGEGLAEFDAKIYFVYVADTPLQDAQGNYATTSCTHASSPGLSAWVAVYHEKDKKWLYNRHLGPVHTDNLGRGSGAGATAVVFNSELYVFTNKQTYKSTDGYGWTATDPPVYNDTSYEPLDALTIYPPIWGASGIPTEGNPKVLLVYGRQTAVGNTYSQLLSGLWDGTSGSGLSLIQSISDVPSYGHASLIWGTVDSPDLNGWGQKVPVAQLFETVKPLTALHAAGTIKHWENFYYYYWGTLVTGPSWHADTLTYPAYGSTVDHLFIFPQYTTECVDDSKATFQDLREWLQVTWFDLGVPKQMTFKSDALVPKNVNIPMSKCGQYGGTATDTAAGTGDVQRVRQHFWTLLGVIVGTSPFSLNNYSLGTEYGPFSNVYYGTDESHTVNSDTTSTNAVVASAGFSIYGGIKDVFKVTGTFDWSFKHAWIDNFGDSTTQTVKRNENFGTYREAYNELGKLGWALFSAPTLVVQNWQAYAYDYNPSTGVGHDLDQTLTTFQQSGATFQKAAFELEDPGGPYDTYPGLLRGMGPFPCSRNMYGWNNRFPSGVTSWETDSRWITKLGESNVVNPDEDLWPTQGQYQEIKIDTLGFVPGSGSEPVYVEQTQHYDTDGETEELKINAGMSLSAGTETNGANVWAKAGYEGTFSETTKTTTGVGTQISFTLDMKSCNVPAPGCVSRLTVQPYWLLAKPGDAGAGAPWIPTAFQNDRPWAIVWNATDVYPYPSASTPCGPLIAPTVSSSFGSDSLAASSVVETSRSGVAPAPAEAFGRIVSGSGGGDLGDLYSHYVVNGGHLKWVSEGSEERIPMTADDFDPSKGVSFEVPNFSWSSSSGNGVWSRSGSIWTFEPNGKVQENRVTLKLDFGAATFDLHLQKADFNGRVPAGSNIVNLLLTVNHKYAFFTPLQHDIDIAWRWSAPPPDADKAHLTSFQGRFNTAMQSGKVSLSGTLPALLPAFGDISLAVNGRPYLAQLIDLDGFQRTFETGGVVKYAKQGVIIVVDFGKKTWSATFNGKAFQELVPVMGKFRARIAVGGKPLVTAEDAVWDYSAELRLRK